MEVLFSAKLSEKHKTSLQTQFPTVLFTFCDNMAEAEEHIDKATVLVTYGEDLTGELVEKAVNLKWIMVISAGLDKMPLDVIREKGIIVTNARGIHKVPMAEYAISMLLQVSRSEKVLIQQEKDRNWDRSARLQEITGKTMIVAGTGAIGQEVARLAKAFRMTTYGVSRSGKAVEFFDKTFTTEQLVELLPEADFLVSVLPSTKETDNLFTYNSFEQLPDHAIFLNMGRGNVVDSEVLLKAVRNGEIDHAVLDVFHEEPLPRDHAFWMEENITVTPHMSGRSPHYVRRALAIFKENLEAYQEGRTDLTNKIDPNRGY
ncbi:D-2-hydroxyacid dehydrogenase [Oceanobacillus halotolerans]|uniref:D-2-hydroxyacid dehydrogenase n=1 Tax=Oceanobacillus halotolerans TaxID=2663380 RepID=UPI0013DCFA97|nr:D-2-hydroxyacid dehydrogenase [Oceanobacillus halotolerans]